MTGPESRVRARLLDTRRETIASVVAAARTVADAWPTDTVTDSRAVARPLRDVLRTRGVGADLVALLREGADALGATILGDPVPAPPYLVFTSRGPVCRATLSEDVRLVVVLQVFSVARRPTTYRFSNPTPEQCLQVRLR